MGMVGGRVGCGRARGRETAGAPRASYQGYRSHARENAPASLPGSRSPPPMPYIDPIVMASLALGLLACAAGAWRLGARGPRLLATFFAAFYGLTLVVMLSAHSADVLYNTVLRSRAMDGSAFGYNWRTYSLLLFGALL